MKQAEQSIPFSNYHFILIHGFGNTPKEMKNLSRWLTSHAIDQTVMTMPFHESEEDFSQFEIEAFRGEFKLRVKNILDGLTKEVIFITTSLSSLTLISMQNEIEVKKHVAISTFLGMSKGRLRLSKFIHSLVPKFKLKRNPNISEEHTAPDLFIADKFSLDSILDIDAFARSVRSNHFITFPDTLFFHSYSDKVASFGRASKFFKMNRHQGDFVTMLGAPHIMSPFVDPGSFFELIGEHFFPSDSHSENEHLTMVTQYEQLNEEHRYWAGRVFNLIVGFLTIFGVLIYQTLSVIVEDGSEAPYYLMSYPMMVFIYVLVASLYFFYLNRTQFFLYTVIEPAMRVLGFQQFKLSRNVSGLESTRFTHNTSAAIIALPFFIATAAFVYALIKYSTRFFYLSQENVLLQSWAVGNLILFYLALQSAYRLKWSTAKTIYAPPTPLERTPFKTMKIFQFIIKSKYREQ